MQKQEAIVILGHGSKSNDAIEDFNFIVETTKTKSEHQNVYGAHMELASPTFEEKVNELATQGIEKIIVIPYFLFNGNHIKEDIPAKIQALKKQFPNVQIQFGNPIGKEPMMADLLLKKTQELTSK